MPPKPKASEKSITRSQTRQAQLVETPKESNTCNTMNVEQEEEFKNSSSCSTFMVSIHGFKKPYHFF